MHDYTNPFEGIYKELKEIKDQLRLLERPSGEPKKNLLTRKETKDFLNVADTTLWRMTKSGALPSYRVGGKLMFKRTDLDSFIEQAAA